MSIGRCISSIFIVIGLTFTLEGATFPIEEITIAQLQAAYLAGQTTAREVRQAYLDRIAAYDKRGPYLNALITVNAQALTDAAKLDAALKSTGKLVGPLHGIPVIVTAAIGFQDRSRVTKIAAKQKGAQNREYLILGLRVLVV